ncbi:MAG: hypothetical protein V2A54_13120 [Bacteroidota bacterium]
MNMKIIILTLVIILTSQFCFGQQEKENEIKRGRVKTLQIDVYDAKMDSGKVVIGKHGTTIYDKIINKYGKKNRLVEKLIFENDGLTVGSKQVYPLPSKTKHNDSTIAYETLNPNSNYVVSKYNNKKRIVESYYIFNKQQKSKSLYKYNDKGLMICQDFFFWGKLDTRTTFSYDDKGLKSEMKTYYIRQNMDSTTYNYQYDENGNCIDEKQLGPKGRLYFHSVKEYNKNRQIISWTQLNSKGKVNSKTQYVFNKFGDKIEQIEYDENGKITRHHKMEYVYDRRNNWIMKTSYFNDKPYEIVLRKIKYRGIL